MSDKPLSPGMLRRQKLVQLRRRSVEVQVEAIAERTGLACKLVGGVGPRERHVALEVRLDDQTRCHLSIYYHRAQPVLDGLEALLVALRAVNGRDFRLTVEPIWDRR